MTEELQKLQQSKKNYDPQKYQVIKEKRHQFKADLKAYAKEVYDKTLTGDAISDECLAFFRKVAYGTDKGKRSISVSRMFDGVIREGAKVTLLEAMARTLLGKAQIDKAISRYQGGKIVFVPKELINESYYEIKEVYF